MARRFGSAMTSNTVSMLPVYLERNIRVKEYYAWRKLALLERWLVKEGTETPAWARGLRV
jgi:hypothetical protein